MARSKRMTTRQGVRLWTIKQAPFMSIGVLTLDFDPSGVTFTEHMAKRTAPGPFDASPIFQGNFDSSGYGDRLYFPRGDQVYETFYANFDGTQGSVVIWWTPEISRDAAITDSELIYRGASSYFLSYTHSTARFTVRCGALSETVDFTSVAGTLYCLVVRWDCNNTLDGTNYACLSINDSHNFVLSTQPTANDVGGAFYIGCGSSGTSPVNAILEGFTVYRRPLYDGSYGVDAGNTDEINLIHAAGAGKKPEEVTGASDICFQLPTDGSAGEIVTGTGEAWGWPWADNELDNYHFQDEVGGLSVKWDVVNGATLANAASADIIFDTRSQKISVDAADEGIKQAFAVSAGEDYYVGAWVKTGGADQGVDLRIYDVTNTADVVELTTDATAWTLLETCFEVPAGCNSIAVYIESTDADTYDIHVGQVQVLPNLIDNGGLEGTYDDESGGGGGTVNVAPGWSSYGCATDGTDTLDESADAHSGSKSQQINVNGASQGIESDANSFTQNKWHLVTVWLKGTSGSVFITDSGSAGGSFFGEIVTPAGSYTRYSWVIYATSARKLRIRSSGAAANFLVDDVSIVVLSDVSITIYPASEANSQENSGIRVDGLDLCTIPITNFKATSGKFRIGIILRHGDDDLQKFGNAICRILELYKDASNRITLLTISDDDLRLDVRTSGSGTTNSSHIDTTGIAPDTEYLFEIEYNSTKATLSIDGVLKGTCTPGSGINFSSDIPDVAYIGCSYLGDHQVDAVFKAP